MNAQGDLRVLASNDPENDVIYPKIVVWENGSDLYYQYIRLDQQQEIQIVEDLWVIGDQKWVFVSFTDKSDYNFIKIPTGVGFNPWAIIIYKIADTGKEPLFTLYPDGRIDTLNDFYEIQYDTYQDNYIVFNLVNKHFNTQIARILFQIDGDYIVQ